MTGSIVASEIVNTDSSSKINIKWSNNTSNISEVKNAAAIKGQPDGVIANILNVNSHVTMSSFSGPASSYYFHGLSTLLQVDEATLARANFIVFEYNGSPNTNFESSMWTFGNGSETVNVEHNFNKPSLSTHLIAHGKISPNKYNTFFNVKSKKTTGTYPFLLFKIPDTLAHDPSLTIQLQTGEAINVGTPDPDAIGLIHKESASDNLAEAIELKPIEPQKMSTETNASSVKFETIQWISDYGKPDEGSSLSHGFDTEFNNSIVDENEYFTPHFIPEQKETTTGDESSEETATIAVEDEAGYVHSLSETKPLTATSWPAKITGTTNPEIQWQGPDHQVYRMVLDWKQQDSKYLQISSEPSIDENTMTGKIKSSCIDCMASLYIFNDKWVKFGEIQTSIIERTWEADIPKVSPIPITFEKTPASGKILRISNLNSLGGSRVSIMIENKTDYFYGVLAKDSIGKVLDTRILGGKESAILEFTAPNIPHIYSIFNEFNIYTEFNLGFFYLQAAYSIIFQEKPPTSYLDGIIDTIYATIGTNPENLYKMDAEELVFLFINLFKDNPKFRKKVLHVFGKEGAEKAALKQAKKIIAIQTIINETIALKHFLGSLLVEDNETYRITVYR